MPGLLLASLWSAVKKLLRHSAHADEVQHGVSIALWIKPWQRAHSSEGGNFSEDLV
jgi:hypothetical protein